MERLDRVHEHPGDLTPATADDVERRRVQILEREAIVQRALAPEPGLHTVPPSVIRAREAHDQLAPGVEPRQPRRGHDGFGAAHVKRDLVEPRDGLEPCDVLRDDRMDAQRGARAHRRPSERSFGRDVHRVRTTPAPHGAQRAAGRKTDPEALVARKPHPAHQQRPRLSPSSRRIDRRLRRAHERDAVAARAHPRRELRERGRDAVDLRRVGLGHEAHVAGHDRHCRGSRARILR